jgi:hypothetical protein
MVAVSYTMMTRTTLIAGPMALLLGACGGSQVHTGYPQGENEPWSSATTLKLSENGEVTSESNVSFPKRARAKWFVVELPAPGKLNVKLRMDPLTTGADVGFELLDAGFNVVSAPIDDNDIGQDEKIRELKEARPGKTYIHVYALNRVDEADFRIRVRYTPKEDASGQVADAGGEPVADGRNVFPWTVPNLPPLPQVGEKDDAPRGGSSKPETPDEPPPPPVEVDPAAGAKLKGRIIEFATSGRGVKIVLNKGSEHGVEDGWTGYVVDTKGKSLPNGAFKVKKVTQDESEGLVGLTLDQIQANRSVVLKASN